VFDATAGNGGLAVLFDGEAGPGVLCQWDGPSLGGEGAPLPSETCTPFSSRSVQNVGGALIFVGWDSQHGYELWSQSSMPTGDFDSSGVIDDADIDLLQAAVRMGSHDAAFDLTGDGFVTTADVTRLVVDILHTSFGDANLDRIVDRRDVAIVAANLGHADVPGWRNGDFSGDGRVGVRDLVIAQSNFAPATLPADAVLTSVASATTERRAPRDSVRLTATRRRIERSSGESATAEVETTAASDSNPAVPQASRRLSRRR
jgi:hypothetical protein